MISITFLLDVNYKVGNFNFGKWSSDVLFHGLGKTH